MKILQIVTQMESGGAQRVAYLLHLALQERGHRCELCFLYLKRPTYAKEDGVTWLCGQQPGSLDYFRIAGRLYRHIRAMRPDAVVTHTHYSNIIGAGVAWLAGARRRIAVHHNPAPTLPGLSRQADFLCGSLGIYTHQIAVSDAVIHSVQGYPERYRKTVDRVYNGIALESHACHPSGRRERFFDSGPVILHVGRFSLQKNHDVLLGVLTRLREAKLVLVGDGERRPEIEQRVRELDLQNRVRFLGEISPALVHEVMLSCDLLLFPSLYEAMPMALLEAMASGMPIIASDIPANRELLQESGLLLPPDPDQFANAAASLFAEPMRAKELGKKAARRAAQFTVAAMADGYERILLAS